MTNYLGKRCSSAMLRVHCASVYLLMGLSSARRLLSGVKLMPVLHNLEPKFARVVYESFDPIRITACSVSLRNDRGFDALSELRVVNEEARSASDSRGGLLLGASTVCSERQVHLAKEFGADYISTMYFSERLVKVANTCSLPVLCGVINVIEALESIQGKVGSFKFYPSSAVTPAALSDLVLEMGPNAIGKDIIIAGGITETNIPAYLKAGATGFAVGVDCRKVINNPRYIRTLLSPFIQTLDSII